MNKDIVEGQWKQLKGKVRAAWGELTDDDIDRIGGRREQWVGALQQRYGKAKDDVTREIDEFLARHHPPL
ncbi:CsbD family protein [Chitinimonas naiadis]